MPRLNAPDCYRPSALERALLLGAVSALASLVPGVSHAQFQAFPQSAQPAALPGQALANGGLPPRTLSTVTPAAPASAPVGAKPQTPTPAPVIAGPASPQAAATKPAAELRPTATSIAPAAPPAVQRAPAAVATPMPAVLLGQSRQTLPAPAVGAAPATPGVTPTTVGEWEGCPDRFRARISRLTRRQDGGLDVWVRSASGAGPEAVLYQWPAGVDATQSGVAVGSPECTEP